MSSRRIRRAKACTESSQSETLSHAVPRARPSTRLRVFPVWPGPQNLLRPVLADLNAVFTQCLSRTSTLSISVFLTAHPLVSVCFSHLLSLAVTSRHASSRHVASRRVASRLVSSRLVSAFSLSLSFSLSLCLDLSPTQPLPCTVQRSD